MSSGAIRQSGASEAEAILARVRQAEPRSTARRLFDAIGPFVAITAVLLGWEITVRSDAVIDFLLPSIGVVTSRIFEDVITGRFFENLVLTVYRALIGFSLSAMVGITIGILISQVRLVRWFFDPVVSLFLPMPKVALIPIFILWFDLFDVSKVMMVMVSTMFTVIIATWSGTRSVERELLWSARSLGASERAVLVQVILPGALPQIITGLQITLPVSMIVTLVTEMAMGGGGLGDALLQAARYADSPGVFAGVLEIAATGFCIIRVMDISRRRLLRWHQETQKRG
ncbi:MAG: ABC transporter permease [Rhodospirillales bacterium]